MPDAPARWTMMVYVAADTPDKDLTAGAWRSLERMRSVGSTGTVKVVAQADFQQQPTRRFYFPQQPDAAATDALHCVEQTISNLNSGSKEAVRDFIAWGQQRCPAEHYAVVLWGHGYGTDDYDPFPRLVAKLAPDPKCYGLDRGDASGVALTADDLERHIEKHEQVLSASMPDFHSRSMLRNRDVGDALREVVANGGKPVSILGMDACTMAMAEVWMEMLRGAAVTVGSEYEIPYNSWPYDVILRRLEMRLRENRAVGPKEVGALIVDAFNDYYSTPGKERTVTLSACDLEHAPGLVDATARLVEVLRKETRNAASRHAIFHARNRTLQFDTHGFIDLRNFCRLLGTNLPKAQVKKACGGVIDALERFVIASKYAPSIHSRLALARGLSVYFPKWVENPDFRSSSERQGRAVLRGHYGHQVFAGRTGWHRLLLALIKEEDSASLDEHERRKKMGAGEQKGRKQKGSKKATKKKTKKH